MDDSRPAIRSTPFALRAGLGQRFCMLHRPAEHAAVRGTLLYLPPFAEELNRTRRAVSETARALACRGFAVLQLDLFGCGDSSGDLSDASFDGWISDALAALDWLRRELPAPYWLWGMRAGTLLATAAAASAPDSNLLLWQPMLTGRQCVSQFLRLKVAREMTRDAEDRTDGPALRAQLAAGATVEVAGYPMNQRLVAGLDAATLALPPSYRGRVLWFEVTSRDPPALSVAGRGQADRWFAEGVAVETHVVGGSAFWQTQEIEVSPDLTRSTCERVDAPREEVTD